MAKQISYGDKARAAAKAGIDKLADLVKATLGPKGRHIVLDRKFGSPIITNDGVTIAKEIELEDPLENMGAQLIREVSSKTNDVTGDGTTTACVLAQAILKEGYRNITAGASGVYIKRGIDMAVERVMKTLKHMAEKINIKTEPAKAEAQIDNIAYISSQNHEIAGKITEAILKVGADGVVTVEEGKTAETTLEIVEGMQFERGFGSPFFMTDTERLEAVLQEPYILITDKRLSDVRELVPVLKVLAETKKPFLIIAEDFDQQVLATLVLNHLNKVFFCCAVKAPGFGERRNEMLHDIATLTGGQVISEELSRRLDKATLEMMGKAKRIVITKETTTIMSDEGDKDVINERASGIRKQIEDSVSEFDKEKLRERLAKLTGGIAVINVGAVTESEMKAKKFKVEDALHATKAAVDEGIIVGGGVALLRASRTLVDFAGHNPDETVGIKIVMRALEEPVRVIASNAGLDPTVVVNDILSYPDDHMNFGLNAESMVFEDLIEAGVIDPVKVTRTALENAASIAGLLLTIEGMVTDIPTPGKDKMDDFDKI